jgi:hypothetical protein
MTTTEEILVRDALRHATEELAAPVHRLAGTAVVRGRRLRRRRRALASAAMLAAVAVIAVPVVGVFGGSADRSGTRVATDPSTSLPAPLPFVGTPSWWDIPATDMLVHLKDLTPGGLSIADPILTNDDRAPGERAGVLRGWLQADVVADGATAGGINVALKAPLPASATSTGTGTSTGAGIPQPQTGTGLAATGAVTGSGQDPARPDERVACPGNLVSPDTCTVLHDAAGVTVGRTSTTTTGAVTVLEVVLRGPDDGLVYVAASNSADVKWGVNSRVASTRVPLTLTELRAIAADPAWTSWRPTR